MKNNTYEKLVEKMIGFVMKEKTKSNYINTLEDNRNVTIIYLFSNEINIQKNLEVFKKYNVIMHDIKNLFDIDINTNFLFITGDWFIYDEEYIENSLIPFSFVDVNVVGKACYFHKMNATHYIIGNNAENKFTNMVHPFTTVLRNDINNVIKGNIFNNITTYLKRLDNKKCYSYYKYGFCDIGKFCNAFQINDNLELITDRKLIKNKNVVIMCNWRRSNRLSKILENLNMQTNTDFIYCIWNNNRNESITNAIKILIKMIKIRYQIIVYDSPINIGGFGRFLMAKHMTNIYSAQNIMFFDDDQELPINFVEDYVERITDKIALNYFGRKFVMGKPYCEINDSGELIKHLTSKCIVKINAGECYDYGGTGGMCIKSKIFNDDLIYQIPLKYLFCEDIWLSWIEDTKYNIKIIKSGLDITNIKDSYDQCHNLWKTKIEFLDFLRSIGWKK
jgi:hypothetical protein